MTEGKDEGAQPEGYDYKRLHSYPLIRVSISHFLLFTTINFFLASKQCFWEGFPNRLQKQSFLIIRNLGCRRYSIKSLPFNKFFFKKNK